MCATIDLINEETGPIFGSTQKIVFIWVVFVMEMVNGFMTLAVPTDQTQRSISQLSLTRKTKDMVKSGLTSTIILTFQQRLNTMAAINAPFH